MPQKEKKRKIKLKKKKKKEKATKKGRNKKLSRFPLVGFFSEGMNETEKLTADGGELTDGWDLTLFWPRVRAQI